MRRLSQLKILGTQNKLVLSKINIIIRVYHDHELFNAVGRILNFVGSSWLDQHLFRP